MVYDILDKMIKSRFLSIYQKKELIFIKKALEEKEKKRKKKFHTNIINFKIIKLKFNYFLFIIYFN